jgi:hypothetical protein
MHESNSGGDGVAVIPTYQEYERAGDLRNGRWEDLIAYVRSAERNKRLLGIIQEHIQTQRNAVADMNRNTPSIGEFQRGYRMGITVSLQDTEMVLDAFLLTDESVAG